MIDASSWDVISGANSTQVVLSVDFPASRRPAVGFPDLAARIGPGFRFLQTRPPAARACQRLTGDAYVGPWISDIAHGQRVAAVLGYRTGSVYAAAIAEGISQWQPMPKIILFDPQFASNNQLGLEFRREISAVSSLLGDDEIAHGARVAAEICQSAAGDIASVAAEMIEGYIDIITAAFERAGLGDARSSKFTALFDSYMSWLSVADQIDPRPVWKRSTVIASSAYSKMPDGACPPADADDDGAAGRMVEFEVGHADLMRSDGVARAVQQLLEAR